MFGSVAAAQQKSLTFKTTNVAEVGERSIGALNMIAASLRVRLLAGVPGYVANRFPFALFSFDRPAQILLRLLGGSDRTSSRRATEIGVSRVVTMPPETKLEVITRFHWKGRTRSCVSSRVSLLAQLIDKSQKTVSFLLQTFELFFVPGSSSSGRPDDGSAGRVSGTQGSPATVGTYNIATFKPPRAVALEPLDCLPGTSIQDLLEHI